MWAAAQRLYSLKPTKLNTRWNNGKYKTQPNSEKNNRIFIQSLHSIRSQWTGLNTTLYFVLQTKNKKNVTYFQKKKKINVGLPPDDTDVEISKQGLANHYCKNAHKGKEKCACNE